MHVRRAGKKRLFCKAQLDRSPSEDEELAQPKLQFKRTSLKRLKTSTNTPKSPARLLQKKLNTITISSKGKLEFADVLRGPFKKNSALL